MTPDVLLVGACAVVAYGACGALEIELPNGRAVSPAAAFGPALAAVSLDPNLRVSPLAFFGAGLAANVLALALTRRLAITAVLHSVGLATSFALVSASINITRY